MYLFDAKLVRVIDGDTIDFELDLGFHIKKKVRIRLKNYDAPETRGESKEEGLKVKQILEDFLKNGEAIAVETFNTTTFDRWLGNVFVDGTDLKDFLNGIKS